MSKSSKLNRIPFKMGKIVDQAKRGWVVRVNGEVVEDVELLEIESPRFGTLTYGLHPSGHYDTWKYKEIGGGGAVTIPYMIHPTNGVLYVGLVKQDRPLLGYEAWEVPRGFMDPSDKDKTDTALREGLEELGYEFSRPIKLAGGKNPNSTFFDTSSKGDGVDYFGLPVMASALVETKDGFAFPNVIQEAAKGDGCEKIYGSKFVLAGRVEYSPDQFSANAVFYLERHIERSKIAAEAKV